jgi:hypothetical protein
MYIGIKILVFNTTFGIVVYTIVDYVINVMAIMHFPLRISRYGFYVTASHGQIRDQSGLCFVTTLLWLCAFAIL